MTQGHYHKDFDNVHLKLVGLIHVIPLAVYLVFCADRGGQTESLFLFGFYYQQVYPVLADLNEILLLAKRYCSWQRDIALGKEILLLAKKLCS